MMTLPGYDEWKLRGPDEDRVEIGAEDGQECNRIHELDEDAPRGCRPRPCSGEMIEDDDAIVCDTCGEIA